MKKLWILTMLLAVLAFSTQAFGATYVSRSVISAGGLCAIGFEPDNVKQIVSLYVNATGTNAGDHLHLWKSSARTTTDITASAAGNTAAMTDLYTTATTNWTNGDWLFIYLISGASAGNYQIVKLTTLSAGVGGILAAALTYTLPFGTYVYCMDDAGMGAIPVGNATVTIDNSSGWCAVPAASPLIIDGVGTVTLSMTAINSCFCVYK
jgi:hypothetical protein